MTSGPDLIWTDADAYLLSTYKKIDGKLRIIEWYCLSSDPKSWEINDVIRDYDALLEDEQTAAVSVLYTFFSDEQAIHLSEWADSELGGKTRSHQIKYKILGYRRDKDGNRVPLKTLDEILQTEEKKYEVPESLGFKAVGVMVPLPEIYKR